MSTGSVLLWFRSDLRVHDHGLLAQAAAKGHPVVALFVWEEAWMRTTRLGWPRMGSHRVRFLAETLADLRDQLAARGVTLRVRLGDPETIVAEEAARWEVQQVWAHTEPAWDEVQLEKRLALRLRRQGVWVQFSSADTLHHRDDLPFAVPALPRVFTQYRSRVEKSVRVRPEAVLETGLVGVKCEPAWEVPLVPREAAGRYAGGERAGLARLNHYLWQTDRLAVYKQTRNGLLNEDDSSKFSPWLACGALSPRRVWHEVKRYEQERGANESTYWLGFELLWRDFFHWSARAHGRDLFLDGGIRQARVAWRRDRDDFERWRTGTTGYALVDACMRELAATGYMSNRGRQVVASFLVKTLGVDWRWGARWFESQLVDCDPASNYGNWQYVAGIGHDPVPFRVFDVEKQTRTYDRDGAFVRRWGPKALTLPMVDFATATAEVRERYRRAGLPV
ncbi:MAG: DASH family cryptochrome [Fimbriimonadaceae bacterium]